MTRLNYSGLVVAGVGFFLTRFTVALAIYESPVRFYLAGVLPLALGLGLSAFGVALTVADVDASVVRTTALWCVIGAGTMLVLVVLTLLGSTTAGMPDFATVRSRTYLSNFLIGGSVGGTLTGLYAARNRRQRSEIRRQADRLELLNRMLRHEVLNALTVIRGYAALERDPDGNARETIESRSTDIERTIEEVRYLTRSAGTGETPLGPVDLEASLAASVETVSERHPAVDVSLTAEAATVRANERLEQVFTHLLENAAVHAAEDDPAVEATVETTADSVSVSVSDRGPGLPESQRTLLETGSIEAYDNPEMGFGLNIVRIHVEEYGGDIDVDADESGTTITVTLPRADAGTPVEASRADLTAVRPATPQLVVTLGASLVAGVIYGLFAEQLGGDVGFIGVYYGVQNAVVGWLTHEFHSVVFGFVFAGLVSLLPPTYRNSLPAYVAVGLGWGAALWIVAAGIISPVWLRLLGIPAPIPNISVMLLWTHLAWGGSLGALTAVGYDRVAPWLAGIRP